MTYLMTHTNTANRRTTVQFTSLDSALLAKTFWLASPKTRRVSGPEPKLEAALSEAVTALRAEQQRWFQIWHYEATRAWNSFRYFIHNLS